MHVLLRVLNLLNNTHFTKIIKNMHSKNMSSGQNFLILPTCKSYQLDGKGLNHGCEMLF